MKELPLVSVIIPCFNSEKWLSETLSSVFNQTYTNIEVIVVDDGSIDNTKKIVLNHSKKIFYYYQKNKGPSAARNLGIKKSKGEYIAFLDSDDLWEKNKLSKQISYLENNKDVHLVFSNVTIMNEKGDRLYIHSNEVPSERKEIIKKFFMGQITMNTPTIVARKDSVLNIGGFDEELPLREDHFFLMIMAHNYKLFHFKEPLVNRRVNQQSMSNSINVEKIFKLNEPFLEKSLAEFPYLSKCSKDVYSKLNSAAGRGYWKIGNHIKSIKYMIKAIYYTPFKVRNYIFLFLVFFRFKHKQLENIKLKLRTKYKSEFSFLSK